MAIASRAPSSTTRARSSPPRRGQRAPPSTPTGCPSPYYLGRDLLDLGDAHLGARGHGDAASAALGRAIELLADGDPPRAHALLARCDAANPDVAAAIAAMLLRREPARRRDRAPRARDRGRARVAAPSLEPRRRAPPARRCARLLPRAPPVHRDERAADRALRRSRSAGTRRARRAVAAPARAHRPPHRHGARRRRRRTKKRATKRSAPRLGTRSRSSTPRFGARFARRHLSTSA